MPFIESLITKLGSHSEDIAAARTLGGLGNLANSLVVPPLIGMLEGREHQRREAAAEALGNLGDLRAVKPLLYVLKKDPEWGRKAAAEALGKLGDLRTIEALIIALDDDADSVRIAAAEALGKLGDLRAVEPLAYKLMDRFAFSYTHVDDCALVRRAAAEALGRLGDMRAIPSLIKTLNDKVAYVRSAAAKALGGFDDARAIEALKEATIMAQTQRDWMSLLSRFSDEVAKAVADAMDKTATLEQNNAQSVVAWCTAAFGVERPNSVSMEHGAVILAEGLTREANRVSITSITVSKDIKSMDGSIVWMMKIRWDFGGLASVHNWGQVASRYRDICLFPVRSGIMICGDPGFSDVFRD